MAADGDDDGLSRQQQIAWLLIGIIVFSAVGGVIAETFTGGFNTYESPGRFNASQGPVVVLGQDYQLEGGQPATASSINLSKEDGAWMNVSGEAGGTSVTVDTINTTNDGSGWTNVSNADVSAANVTLHPRRKNFTRIGDGIDALQFRDIKVDDGQIDLNYTASSEGTIVVETNATDGTAYGLVDVDTEEGLDVAIADSDGVIAFTEVPAATNEEVRIEQLGTLSVRNESEPHGLITGATVEFKFFETVDDNPTIEQISDDDQDGQIDLTGLPIDETFAVSVKAPNYNNRTVILDDLSQQESVFLPHTNETTVEVSFVIDDQTGDFGADSQFVVQKAINRSEYNGSPSGFSWTNVAGDEIGAQNQFIVDLMHEDRYRLRISNDEGQTRLLGTHVAELSQTVTITIRDVSIDTENLTTDVSIGFEKDEDNNELDFVYEDDEDLTTDLEVVMYERGNPSNEVHNQTHAGPFGELVIEESLTADEMNESWVVEISGSRDGETVDATYLVGGKRVDPGTPVPDWVKHFASVFAILLVPTVLGGERAETGAVVATAIAGVLWWIQWTPPGITILSIILAASLAIGFKMRQRGAGNIR